MARYTLAIFTYVNSSVTVEVPDEVTDPTEIAERALEQDQGHSLCHGCARDLDLGDEWQYAIDPETGKPDVMREVD